MDSTRKNMIFTGLFCALYVIGTIIRIPLGPVPIVMTNLFLVLAGYILGPKWGCLSVILYLFLGLLGLPIFSFGGGIVALQQPTAGFLAGYIILPLIAGFFRNIGKASFPALLIGGLTAMLSLYVPGLLVLQHVLELSLSQAVIAGGLPYLPGDFLKLAVALSFIQIIKLHKPDLLLNLKKHE